MVSDVVLKIEEDNDERRMDAEVRERDRIRLEHQAHEGKRARHVQVNTTASPERIHNPILLNILKERHYERGTMREAA